MGKRMINLCFVVVFVAAGFIYPDSAARAQEMDPQPMFGYNPCQQIINAVDWPLGAVLSLVVDDPATGNPEDHTASGTVTGFAPWNPEATLYTFDTSAFDIQPGYEIKISTDGIEKDTIVTSLEITDVVPETRTVYGITGPNATFNAIGVGEIGEFYSVTSDESGNWDVTFEEDLSTYWFLFFIEKDDDGDTTEVMYFSPPLPGFTVHPEHGWVGGWGWFDGEQITLSIDNDDDLTNGTIIEFTALPGDPEWDPGSGEIFFELWDQGDIFQLDRYVSVSDGTTTKMTQIVPLSFDSIYTDDIPGMASGIGPPNGEGHVCLDHYSGCIPVTVAGDGTWSAYFDWYMDGMDLYDAHIVIWDIDGDEVMANFPVEEPPPTPMFTVQPDHGWVGGWGWPIDEEVTLVVDDDQDPDNGILFSTTSMSFEPEWGEGVGEIFFELWDQPAYLEPGNYVSVSVGLITKVTRIVPLSFDSIHTDDIAGLASGIGPPYGEGHVCLDHNSECIPVMVEGDGTWSAYFDWYVEGMDLYSAHIVIWDIDGDETMANLPVEEPAMVNISAYPQFDQIDGSGFPVGSTVTLVVDDDDNPDTPPLYVATAVAEELIEEPGVTLVRFFLAGEIDVQPGQYLIMFTDEFFQIHQVEYLDILDVDLDADEVVGVADPGEQIEVWIYWTEMIITDTDGAGQWTADFSVGPSVWDLQYGDMVTAGILDEAGNGTWHYYLYSPIAEDDTYTLDEDQVLSVPRPGVLENDIHAVPVPLEAELVSETEFGLVVLNPDGSFTYTPEPDFFGQDSFTYRAKDDRVQSDPALVTITVNPVNDAPEVSLPSVITADEGQLLMGSGTFYDPDPDTWTGTVDYGDGSALQTLSLTTHQSFDLSHIYPDSGVYTISVVISDGFVEGDATAEVIIYNVAPSVSITSLAGGKEKVLVGLDVVLLGSFFDPGQDAHTALIDWGDGTELVDPAFSPITVNHAYQSPGLYTITLTVTDDDGGMGMASATLMVIEPADAAEDVITELDSILINPDIPPEVATAIENALVDLEGANDGLSKSGALDKIVGGQWNAALVKIEKAIQDLEAAEALDPTLDLSDLKEYLVLTAKSVTIEIIQTAEADGVPLAVIDQAYDLVSMGQALLDVGDYLGAVGKFREALQVL
jgi:hypothetical protein